jgi:type I restriction enzyme M protein
MGHNNAWKATLHNGDQLLSYVQQAKSTQFICLYSSDFIDNKLLFRNQIVTLVDNEKLLEEKENLKPASYKEAKKVEDLYKAWVEKYSQNYASKGIFEYDIPAYHKAKQKFSLADLQTISSKDIRVKYHEFATILRQHT